MCSSPAWTRARSTRRRPGSEHRDRAGGRPRRRVQRDGHAAARLHLGGHAPRGPRAARRSPRPSTAPSRSRATRSPPPTTCGPSTSASTTKSRSSSTTSTTTSTSPILRYYNRATGQRGGGVHRRVRHRSLLPDDHARPRQGQHSRHPRPQRQVFTIAVPLESGAATVSPARRSIRPRSRALGRGGGRSGGFGIGGAAARAARPPAVSSASFQVTGSQSFVLVASLTAVRAAPHRTSCRAAIRPPRTGPTCWPTCPSCPTASSRCPARS